MKFHENILVFYRRQCIYNPQFETGRPYRQLSGRGSSNYGSQTTTLTVNEGLRYPSSVQMFPRDRDKIHPTQKPIALFEYLIRTYTDEGMVVLDNTAGSGTTAVAAENAGRQWICIERDQDYAAKAIERIRNHVDVEPSTIVPFRQPATLSAEQRAALLSFAAAA
jgi:site-specific DNA-methyltransferase (adenine-specific)